jgi:two-component system response regulator DesR
VTHGRVLLVDDHPVVLQGVRQLLAGTDEFEVVAESTSASEGLAAARREQPDLIVLDLRIGDALAPDLCTRLRLAAPRARIVILTAFEDEALLRACLQAGAAGILLKDAHGLELVQALRRVRAGETVLDERIDVRRRGSARGMRTDEGAAYESLTPREHEVLRLMVSGLTSREIGEELCLAPNTVRTYTQSLLSKLHAKNRIQALATAKQLRLI